MFRSPEREAFLRAALRSLRPGRARAALERELRGHMDDAAEAYRAQGLPPEEAEARAVASMGDPKALARQIRQAHRPAAPVGALVLLAAMGAASAVLQTASQGAGALASRLLALALGGALGAAALCLDARRAARWAAPLLGGLVAAFLAAAALTPRISGGYPPVDALAALLAPGLGLLAGRLRLRRGGAILLGAAALGAMALCAALGSRAGALLSAAVLAGAALELGRRGAWRAGRGAAWAVAAALVLGGALAAVLLVRQRLGPGAGAPLRQEFRARPARGRSLCRSKNGPVGRLPAGAPDRAMGRVGVAGAAGAAAGPGLAPVPDGPARPGPGGRGGCGGLRGARGGRAAAPLAPGGKRWYALSLRGVAPRGEERARMRRERELRILPVGPENRAACLGLRTAPGQEGFVESVEDCLREAQGYGAWRPVALLRGEEVVGFAMYGFFPMYKPAGRVWLDRLLIGAAHQGRGYGRAALGLLLARLRAEYGNRDVYLSVVAGNEAAARLYASFGFVRTGEKDVGGEEVYVRRAEEILPPS